MSSSEIEDLKKSKSNVIEEFISLKKKHQQLYYDYQELIEENKVLKKKVDDLKSENNILKEGNLVKENKNLIAKLKQLRRSSVNLVEKQQISLPTHNKSCEYEVEKLMNHRGRKGKREYLVRWQNFDSEEDTWEKESNLKCPIILKEYQKKTQIEIR